MTVETDQGLLDTVCIYIEHGEPSSTQHAYTSRLVSTARQARHSMHMHRAFQAQLDRLDSEQSEHSSLSLKTEHYIVRRKNSSQYHIVKGPSLLTISGFGHKSWKPVVKLAETTHFPRVKTHHFSESGLLVKSCDPRTHVFLLQLPTTQPQQE